MHGPYSKQLITQLCICTLCITTLKGECGGSVVECQTPEREVGGSKPTTAVLCP